MATRRVTMREAADILGVTEIVHLGYPDGVSKEAVRKRVIRGTLPSDTGEDGRRHVYLDVGREEAPTHERDALISQLRDEVAYLRDENRRKDEIIMQQAMTMRQITAASQEPPESPESPAPTSPLPRPPERRSRAHRGRGGVGCS